MKLLVLVNGGEDSAAGSRARLLLTQLNAEVSFLYRSSAKLRSLSEFVKAGLRMRPNQVYVMDTAWSGVFAGLFIKLLTRSSLTLDTGDATYALARSMGRVGRLGCLAVGLTEWIGMAAADLVVVRGRYHRNYLRDRGQRRVVQVPDCVKVEVADGVVARAREIRRGLNLENVLVVGVVGSCVWSPRLGICYGWDLVEALALLPGHPIHGVVVGDGDGVPHLRQRAAEMGITERLTFIPSVGSEEVSAYVAMMDIGLSTQTDDIVGWVRTTGKLPLYLLHRRFILATDVGEASWVLPREMLVEYRGVVDHEYPARLADRLAKAEADRRILEFGQEGLGIVRRHFDVDKLAPLLATELGIPSTHV